MANIDKPADLSKVWASGGDILTPTDAKIGTGWEVEIPPRQWFNWLDNRQDQAIAHINQHGVVVWDIGTEYQANKSYVQGSTDGIIYRCVATHTGQNPVTDASNTYWKIAFLDLDALKGSNQSLAVNGYQKIPGGLIVQWGSGNTVTGNADLVSFPLTFPNNVFSIAVNEANAGTGWAATPPYPTIYGTSSQTPSSFRVSGVRLVSGTASYEGSMAFKWIAVGY